MKSTNIILYCLILLLISTKVQYPQNFWQTLNGPLGYELQHIKVDSSNNKYVISGFQTTSARCFRSTDGGSTWLDFGLPGTSAITFDKNGYFYIITNASPYGTYRSINGGQNWTEIRGAHYKGRIEADGQNNIFLVIDNYLYKSTDYGNNWTVSLNLVGGISSLYISKQGHIFVSSSSPEGGLYKSIDGGNTFDVISNLGYIDNVAVNSLGHIFMFYLCEIYRSTDNGQTWDKVFTHCPSKDIFISLDDIIYVTVYNSGVFRSTNNGADWEQINSGLVNLHIFGLVQDQNGYLYVTADVDGVYRSVSPVVGVVTDHFRFPKSFTLAQNYPNPFNPTTKIRYNIPELSLITLKVYDVLGNEIATLVNEEKPIGSYDIDFNANQLPSGVYFYQLIAGDFVAIKKMILMK